MCTRLFLIVLFLFSGATFASSSDIGYLPKDKTIDITAIIGAPPAVDSLRFATDKAISEPVYSISHDSIEFKQAVMNSADSVENIMDSFSEAFGQELSASKTPAIYKVMSKSITDVNNSKNIAKNFYKRQRPYVFYGREPCVLVLEDYDPVSNFSYPSGHTSRAWIVALLLASLKNTNTTAIFEKAKSIGVDRINCGVHWQSDVEASLTVATANFVALQSINEYQEDLANARNEVVYE